MDDFNNWSKIADAFDEAQSQVVRKTAFDWQANMQAKIRANGQIDFGYMVNSVYVRTYNESTYSQLPSPKRKGVTPMPEVERPPDNKTAYLVVAAPYGWWQNYGTSRIPARPFVEPSHDLTQPSFDEALRRIDEKLKSI